MKSNIEIINDYVKNYEKHRILANEICYTCRLLLPKDFKTNLEMIKVNIRNGVDILIYTKGYSEKNFLTVSKREGHINLKIFLNKDVDNLDYEQAKASEILEIILKNERIQQNLNRLIELSNKLDELDYLINYANETLEYLYEFLGKNINYKILKDKTDSSLKLALASTKVVIDTYKEHCTYAKALKKRNI